MHWLLLTSGCVSDKVNDRGKLAAYQRRLAARGPQARQDANDPNAPLGLLTPVDTARKAVPDLKIDVDPNTGRKVAPLSLDEAIARSLSNSPEIRVVSFDPEIARHEVTKEVGGFDPAAFSRINYEDQDAPPQSSFQAGQAENRLFESGVRQRTVLGTEWSASYALSRIWDDLTFFRSITGTRYEPMVIFQLRQPLLRDAGWEVNLAGVNIAKLNYEAALQGFRERAEAVAAGVIAAYWRLAQAQHDLQIQRELVEQTEETLHKVAGRRDIDATDVQIKQAESYALSRKATLLDLERRVTDVQDALARLLADPQINTTSELAIVPTTNLESPVSLPEQAVLLERSLATAVASHPVIQQAQLGVKVAEINVEVAENQKMPRLDLVASARGSGLSKDRIEAHDQIGDWQYATYGIGVTFEYPLGNRERQAEWLRRKVERRKAVSILQNTADQIAVRVREAMRRVQTSEAQVKVQAEAAEAARVHLRALEESEAIRERLTPEFLLVKLQAQETHAQARRAQVDATAELNVALTELAQATGTVLNLQTVDASVSTIVDETAAKKEGDEQKTPLIKPWEISPSF
jgi:outer membrane protein TolC